MRGRLYAGFYCPAATLSLTAQNRGLNGVTSTVSFSVANTDTLFASSANWVFDNLAGPGDSGSFAWGAPFFGRTGWHWMVRPPRRKRALFRLLTKLERVIAALMRIHFWSVLALAACGSGSSNSIVPGSDGGTGGDLANLASGADLATTRTDMAAPPKTALPTAFGSYIELGDSISDGGGEPPFFYNLLFSNDDVNYPTWSGLDLKTRFNVQQHVHGAVAGAQTKDVPGQVTKLPASLPGPVLITITIGGNDITNNAVAVIQNNDMTAARGHAHQPRHVS